MDTFWEGRKIGAEEVKLVNGGFAMFEKGKFIREAFSGVGKHRFAAGRRR